MREAYGSLETWKHTSFHFNPILSNNTYTITSIKVANIINNNYQINKRLVFVEAVLDGSKKKIKFSAYKEPMEAYPYYPVINNLPVYFVEKMEEFEKLHLGEKITNPLVKDEYEITKVFFGKQDAKSAIADIMVQIRNLRTNETFNYPYATVKDDAFVSAFRGQYHLALSSVEKPEDSSNRYGNTKTIEDEGVTKYSYEDDIMNIVIYADKEQFNFVLKNVSSNSIKIIWNEAAFVDIDGSTSKIMHVGTKYSEKNSDQPATTIIKGAKIDDILVPTANVYYSTYGNSWKTKYMLPDKYIGKEPGFIRIMLPIQIKDVINEYTFEFKLSYIYEHPELINSELIP